MNEKPIPPASPMTLCGCIKSPSGNRGFTLIELMVVIALLSLVLYAVIPNFSSSPITAQPEKAARLLIAKIRSLRPLAVQERRLYVLHVDMDRKRIWSSHEGMTEEEIVQAAEGAIVLTDDLGIREVVLPARGSASSGTVEIPIYPGGYAEHAFIVLEASRARRMALEIQPFLPDVRIHEIDR